MTAEIRHFWNPADGALLKKVPRPHIAHGAGDRAAARMCPNRPEGARQTARRTVCGHYINKIKRENGADTRN
ncbi:hypothetical protein JUN65_03310 [Gluconacetobacter azotocaptans]|uniref:hypothetical protein n=1 Tax=Gluconacetobacter azotocaptans TaxID=142834 RepID=UPI00195A65FD|nr:hypothetical protein [Gluconacetobacter azotocaptans]MBM9400620.1 hypothetical protein [Gluconacetobacter azotocaptans]